MAAAAAAASRERKRSVKEHQNARNGNSSTSNNNDNNNNRRRMEDSDDDHDDDSDSGSAPEGGMPRVVHAIISIPQEDGSSHTTAISRWTRPGNPSGGELIVMSSSHSSHESVKARFLSHFKSRDCYPLWRDREADSDSGDSDTLGAEAPSDRYGSDKSKPARNRSRAPAAATAARVADKRSETSKVSKNRTSKAGAAESSVVREGGHVFSDDRGSSGDSVSEWSDWQESDSELDENEYHQVYEDHKHSRKYKSATEFHNVFGALKRGFLNKKALDWSALRTRRQKEPRASGAEGFPGNVTASVVGEVVDKDHVLQNQNIVGMPEGEGTTNVNKAGEEDQLNQQPRSEALESFRSKYKYTAAGIPRHLVYKKSEVPNPAPVDEQWRDNILWKQEQKAQKEIKLENGNLEAKEKLRKSRQNSDVGSKLEKLEPELAQELFENKQVERESELQVLAMHRSGAELEEVDEEIGLCRALNADQCPNGSRSIMESNRRIEFSCSEGCFLSFHFQACWQDFEKNFQDKNADWKMVHGAACVTPDCPGKLIKVQTRERKQVIHELVEELKNEKTPAAHRDLPSSQSKRLEKRAKRKSKEARPSSAEIAEQAGISKLDSSSSESFERRDSIESAELSNASASNVAIVCDVRPEEDMELSAAGEDSTTTTVVLEAPLQVYKKENEEVMAVSKEPKRKSKVKKSKSKGKKVHLFRDGFTLPSAEEQEDDSDSGVVGMAHGDWSGQVLSSLTSELLAEFPPLSAGGSSVLTNPKSTVFTPLAVLKEQSLLVDPEHQESIRSPHMLIENVHPQADYAEIKDFLTQGGTVVHLELFRDYHIATVSMGSWEEAITARVLTNDISVRGMKLKCAYFLKQQLPPDIFYNVAEEYLLAHEFERATMQHDEISHNHGSMRPGSPLPAPAVKCAINSQPASTLSCQPTQSQASGPAASPTPIINSMTLPMVLAPSVPHAVSPKLHGTNLLQVSTIEPVSKSPVTTIPHGSDSSSGQLTESSEVLKGTSMKSFGTTLRVTAKPFVIGESSMHSLRRTEDSSISTAGTFAAGSISAGLSKLDSATASNATYPASISIGNSSITSSSLTSSSRPGTPLVDTRSFMHVSDAAVSSVKADENRIPHYSTIHNCQFPPSPDFHQPPFPQNNNSHVYYSNNINEPNWMLTQTESASGFPPLEYGTPSLSPSPYPVQEYSKPSSLFGQVIGCNNETLAMYKQMRRFCVSTKHLLAVPRIAPGTCMLFLYNIMTQQTSGVYQSTSCGMQQMMGPMMQSMLAYAPSVGFETLHDFSIPLTGTELESVFPGATQMSGRSLFLSFSQVNQVLSILRLKNKAQTLSMDFGIPCTKFDTELQKTTSEDRVSAPANLNLTTSSLDFAVPPSPLSISSDGNFPGNESWSPKASTVGSELGLELENRVEETIPPLVKERPQLSPMELFPHLFPKAIVADQQEKTHDTASKPVERDPLDPQFRSLSVYKPLVKNPPLQHPTPVPELVSQFLLPRPKQAYNPLAFQQDREKQQVEGEMGDKELPFKSSTSSDLSVSQDRFLGVATGSSESLTRIQEAVDMEVSSTSSIPTGSLHFPCLYEVVSPKEEHRVREGPQETAKEIGLFQRGAIVEASSQHENWLRVKFSPHSEAWTMAYDMHKTYLRRRDMVNHVATSISDVMATSSSAFSASSKLEDHFNTIPTESIMINEAEPAQKKHAHLCCYCYARPPDHLILDCRHLGPCLDCKNTKPVDICRQPNCGVRVTKMLRIHL